MGDNYVVYHCHSMLSNCTTNIDSCTPYQDYVDRAKELGMKALCFSEHGNIFGWYQKKQAVEKAGMLYIHGAEFYLTETLEEKVRDNYHCVMMARNYDGVKEINRLFTQSYNRDDGHFYYVPRITIDDMVGTSDNIIITSACLSGVISKGAEKLQEKVIDFYSNNKHRCFLEIQHHNVEDQKNYNKKLQKIYEKTTINLIAGTDTHGLNKTHLLGRKKLQEGKNVHFDNEDNWDLSFKSYDELVLSYKEQDNFPEHIYMSAIKNTNRLLELIEPFSLDMSFKYPKIYDNPLQTLKDKINEGYKENKHLKKYPMKELRKKIDEEIETFKAVGQIDFMLLERYIKEWEVKNNIVRGPGRGSVTGSIVAYILGITEMDSIKFDLNFFRFSSPARVSLGDIDIDYGDKDRDRVKEFLLKDRMNISKIKSSEIVTFNTIALKGAIKDIGRALNMDLGDVQEICNAVKETTENGEKKQTISDDYRKKYKELFKFVDIVNGTIVSIGTHPSGVLLCDRNIEEEIGLCSVSSSPYPVSCLNMKELDAQNFVKLDVLG